MNATGVFFKGTSLDPAKACDEVTIHFDVLKKELVPFRGKLQCRVSGEVSPFTAQNPAHVLTKEVDRVLAFAEMVKAAKQYPEDALEFFLAPHEVRAKAIIKKGALQLFPLTDLKNFVFKQMGSSFLISKDNRPVCYLEGQAKVRSHLVEEWKPETIMSGFFWVKSTSDDKEVNMKLSKVSINGYSFPIMENTKLLKEFDILCFKASQGSSASKAGSSASKAAPAPKKARRA